METAPLSEATPQRQNPPRNTGRNQSFGASVVSLQKKAAVLSDKNNLAPIADFYKENLVSPSVSTPSKLYFL